MMTKTLLLAAAAVLSLGVGSAFAESDGSGNSYFDSTFKNGDVAPSKQPAPVQQATGANAGDAIVTGSHEPRWIEYSATGGGG